MHGFHSLSPFFCCNFCCNVFCFVTCDVGAGQMATLTSRIFGETAAHNSARTNQKKKTDHDHESSSRDRARERAESTELRAAPRSKLHTSRPNEQPCAPSIAFASRLAWSPRSGACRTPQQQHDRRRRTPNDDDDEEGNGAHTKKKLLFPSAAAAWLDLDAARRSVWVHAHTQ